MTKDALHAENERLRAALTKIIDWAHAYPVAIFPVPDIAKAHAILKEHDMTVDAISAHAMRHVLDGVSGIALAALGDEAVP